MMLMGKILSLITIINQLGEVKITAKLEKDLHFSKIDRLS